MSFRSYNYFNKRTLDLLYNTTYWNGTLEDGDWTIHGDETSYVIYIDPEGTRWMDLSGLAKWDGTSWYTYTTTNSGLSSNSVNGMVTDAEGTLWIATSVGVAAYNPEGFPVAAFNLDVSENELTLYPNPAGDHVFIHLQGNQPITKVQLYDLQGKLYRELKGTRVIPTSSLKKGLYLIEIETQTGIYKGKILK